MNFRQKAVVVHTVRKEFPRFLHWLQLWMTATNCSPALWLWPSAMRYYDMLADAGIDLLFLCRIKGTLSVREGPKKQLMLHSIIHLLLCVWIWLCVSRIGNLIWSVWLKSKEHCAYWVRERTSRSKKKQTANIGVKCNIDKINFYTRKLRRLMKKPGLISQLYAHLCEPPLDTRLHTSTQRERERVIRKEWVRKSDKEKTFRMYLHLGNIFL